MFSLACAVNPVTHACSAGARACGAIARAMSTRRDDAGRLHHDTLPAVDDGRGTLEWYAHGRRHRAHGPAVVRADGTLEWWRNGVRVVPLMAEVVTATTAHAPPPGGPPAAPAA